jgi:hypothetical protein
MYYGKAGDGGASDGAGTFAAFDDFSTNRIGTFWGETEMSNGGWAYPDTHTVTNGGYLFRQTVPSDRCAAIGMINPVPGNILCSAVLDYTGRYSSRGTPWNYFGIGFSGNASTYMNEFGYWGWVLNYNPNSPSDKVNIQFTNHPGAADNAWVYRDTILQWKGHFGFNNLQKPCLAVRTGHLETIIAYWRNFYARSYTPNEPMHGDWSYEKPATGSPFPGYAYMKTHEITGSPDGDLSDYQVKLIAHRGAGPTGTTVYSDGDGLSDDVEIHGFSDRLGHRFVTLPDDPDTDGDGLLDGEEAGERTALPDGSFYYAVKSYPNMMDSDGDTLWDDVEYYYGTKPLQADSDSDGLDDRVDPHPLTFDYPEVAPGTLEVARIILKGAIFGDMGDEGGWLHFLVGDDSNSPFYVVGAIVGGFIPISDLRDLFQSLVNLDLLGSLLNAVGFVPGPGDAVKITGTIGIFMVKHAGDTKYIVGVTQETTKHLLLNMPSFIYQPVLRALTNNQVDRLLYIGLDWNTIMRLGSEGKNINKLASTSDRLIAAGSDSDAVKELIENAVENGGTLSVTLDNVKRAVKSNAGSVDTMWLEEGRLVSAKGAISWARDTGGSGWAHIRNNHIINPNGNEFLMSFGPVYAEESKIIDLILDTAKTGDEVLTSKGLWRIKLIDTPDGEKQISVLVGNNGYIVTAHPGPP